MNGNGAGVSRKFKVPDVVEKLLPREHLSGVACQEEEEVEFPSR
jgi:hypothetical protein